MIKFKKWIYIYVILTKVRIQYQINYYNLLKISITILNSEFPFSREWQFSIGWQLILLPYLNSLFCQYINNFILYIHGFGISYGLFWILDIYTESYGFVSNSNFLFIPIDIDYLNILHKTVWIIDNFDNISDRSFFWNNKIQFPFYSWIFGDFLE